MTLGSFFDLDGTIVFSGRILRTGIRSVPVERASDGSVISWMTARAADVLLELRARTKFVPTTTRVQRQLDRVRLPGGHLHTAIYANGMRIRWKGKEDTDWSAELADASWGCSPLDDVMRAVDDVCDGRAWVQSVYSEDGIGVIVTARGSVVDATVISWLKRLCADSGHALWIQGRKLFLIPAHGTKERAANEVARRLGVSQAFAAGDTSLDRGLLEWADVAAQPAHAEPGGRGVRTTESGLFAGEQLLEMAAAWARHQQPAKDQGMDCAPLV